MDSNQETINNTVKEILSNGGFLKDLTAKIKIKDMYNSPLYNKLLEDMKDKIRKCSSKNEAIASRAQQQISHLLSIAGLQGMNKSYIMSFLIKYGHTISKPNTEDPVEQEINRIIKKVEDDNPNLSGILTRQQVRNIVLSERRNKKNAQKSRN